MQDYSNAPPQQDFDVIPAGTLLFGILSIKPYGPPEAPDRFETPSKTSDAQFLDCTVTCVEGPFNKRKVFTRIGTRGSEAYINMGRSAIRSILEVGRGASTQNVAGYRIASYEELNGLKVAIEVKVETGQGTYKDKNDVQSWLTPNAESATSKKFAKLLDMAKSGYAKEPQPATGAAQQPAWTTGQVSSQPAATTQAPPATAKPAWLNT